MLKYEKCYLYYSLFYQALIEYKAEIFRYVQSYYRCFMGNRAIGTYPIFDFK